MVTLEIKIEAGYSIENAFKEAIRLSLILFCTIEFKFNSVTCFAYPNGSIEKGVENYNKAIKNPSKYKFANSTN